VHSITANGLDMAVQSVAGFFIAFEGVGGGRPGSGGRLEVLSGQASTSVPL
jgi:hypothetical protein